MPAQRISEHTIALLLVRFTEYDSTMMTMPGVEEQLLEGNAIEAIAESKVASTFETVMNVNHCYTIVDYICTTARPSSRTVFTNAFIRLGNTTTVLPIQNTCIPYYYFKFISFEEVEAHINKTDYLTDFIGCLHDVHQRTLGNKQRVINMILKHERSSKGTMAASSTKHFFKLETWKTLCMLLNSDGNCNLSATVPILEVISKGPMYLSASLPAFPNLITPFHGDTLRNTLSPTSKDNGFLRTSA